MIARNLKKILIFLAAVIIIVLGIIAAVFIFNACHSKTCSIAKSGDNVILKTNVCELKSADINYGDEVEVTFSTGYKAVRVPVYTDDYGIGGTHVLYAKTDSDQLHFCLSHEDGVWNVANLHEGDTATITRAIPGKFSAALSGFEKGYNRHFHNLHIGDKYYGGLPINKEIGIEYVIDTDHDEVADGVDALDLSAVDIKKKDCNDRMISALLKMPTDKKIAICSSPSTEFFTSIVMALADKSYEEIASDYMSAYHDLTDEEYGDVKTYTIDAFLHKLTRTEDTYDMSKCDMKYCAERYLRSCGVSGDDLDLIFKKLV